jgi:hypothetical protein
MKNTISFLFAIAALSFLSACDTSAETVAGAGQSCDYKTGDYKCSGDIVLFCSNGAWAPSKDCSKSSESNCRCAIVSGGLGTCTVGASTDTSKACEGKSL